MSDDLIGGGGVFRARRRRRDVRRLAEAGTPDAARTLVEVLLRAADGQLAEIAERGLRQLTDQAAIDALCEAPLEYDDTRLTTLIDEAGHRHSDPARRATLLFLAGDFDAYAELDFDGTMLAAARAVADGPLRTRLAARARESGRLEWVRAIAPARPGPDAAADVSEAEWDAAVGILTATGRLDELWRLVQHAPPVWGAHILGELDRRGWRPTDGPDADGFAELTTLAGACSGCPGAGVLDPEPAQWDAYGTGEVSLSFTTDGSALVAGKNDGFHGAWWLDEENQPTHHVTGTDDLDGVNDVLAVPVTDAVAVAGMTGSRICRPERAPVKGIRALSPDHPRLALDLAATSDGRLVVGASAGVVVWRPPWQEPDLLPHTEQLHGVAVSPAGGGCAAGFVLNKPTVLLWNLTAGGSPTPLTGHKGQVHCLATTPDGRLLISGGSDGTIRLWHLPSGEPAGVISSGHTSLEMRLAVTPDGGLLVSAGVEGALRLWHLPSGAPAGVLTEDGPWVTCLTIRPDGRLLATADSDMTVRLWHLPSGEAAGTLTGPTGDRLLSDLAFSPDGTPARRRLGAYGVRRGRRHPAVAPVPPGAVDSDPDSRRRARHRRVRPAGGRDRRPGTRLGAARRRAGAVAPAARRRAGRRHARRTRRQ
ncbi:hypothetical protein [Streptomyces synnematoformans]|uniref:WD40 repeat domain-containing protein n=1 Tax=Streptomyces synnematoformans TaxID=415721 RepID=A0ABN2XC57_9ACTN